MLVFREKEKLPRQRPVRDELRTNKLQSTKCQVQELNLGHTGGQGKHSHHGGNPSIRAFSLS